MPKPTGNLPDWDTNGTNSTEPPAGKKSDGWAVDEPAASSYFNWWMNKLSQWMTFFNELTPGSNIMVPAAKDFQYATPPTRTLYCNAFDLGSAGPYTFGGKDRIPYLDHDNTNNTPGEFYGRILVPGGAVVTAVEAIFEGEGLGAMNGKVTKLDGLAVSNLETGGAGVAMPTVAHSGFGFFARSIPLQGGSFVMPNDGYLEAYVLPAAYAGYIGVVPALRVYGFRVTCTTANVRPNT
jgi:hypothetical protein